ncbi:Hypothetical protein PHPALM_8656 [Phytophthora palmivora]|uniref:BZIP domain-containing protein n=1 Tax=Phytophthora palmivora TaxID=4796 RepID=A0A2P4Y9B4_9STRA|nr:Hypothetical protein PHPALM_8656 [Phytophthora palmivora]
MNTSTLFPPNRQCFSDVVIGTVSQRDQPFRTSIIPPKMIHRFPSLSRTSIIGRKRLYVDAVDSNIEHSKVQKTTSTRPAPAADDNAKYTAEIELRRQRNRMHQAKYKMRQRKLVSGLESSVQNLKQEIQELELHHRFLSYGLSKSTTIWGVAAEFFRLFRHGVKQPMLEHESPTSFPYQNYTQWRFMETRMADDVTDGVVFGVKAVMENLILQSKCYQDMDLCPLRMDYGPGDSLIVTTTCEFSIAEETLIYGFPNLVNGGLSPLAEKMLGKKIVVQGSTYFNWDNASGRVTQLQWKMDLLTPMLQLLGSLEDVVQVFDSAKLSPEVSKFLHKITETIPRRDDTKFIPQTTNVVDGRRRKQREKHFGRVQSVLSSCPPCVTPAKLSTFSSLSAMTDHLKRMFSSVRDSTDFVFDSASIFREDVNSPGAIVCSVNLKYDDPIAGSCIELLSSTPLTCNVKSATSMLWKMLLDKEVFGPKSGCYTMKVVFHRSKTFFVSLTMIYSV